MKMGAILGVFRKKPLGRGEVDAQTYTDATIENAIHSTDAVAAKLEKARAQSFATNERLVEGIEQMRTSIPRATLLGKLIQDAKGFPRQ